MGSTSSYPHSDWVSVLTGDEQTDVAVGWLQLTEVPEMVFLKDMADIDTIEENSQENFITDWEILEFESEGEDFDSEED